MKLFQNLSTDLAEEVVSSLLLFIALVAILSNGGNHLSNVGRGLAKEHFYEIISKSVHWFSSRSCLKKIIYSSGGHLVQQSGIV